ncbi:MAG: tetratricopeptide repeat protein [Acidobacteria bacterium]|nr:tetratricopeptide repeat protein [Acidobacteriota bacterium]
MLSRNRSQTILQLLVLTLLLVCAPHAAGQDRDELSDESADPVKLFNLGQDAHAKKDYAAALDFYEQAIKIRPEFPEAEYQRGGALIALGREAEAEKAYRRALELRANWAMPTAALGILMTHDKNRASEAETLLRRALELDPKNLPALTILAELRTRAGDARESVDLWRRATAVNDHAASLWLARGEAEQSAGDAAAALKSFALALSLEPDNATARLRRAGVYLEADDKESAAADARALEGAARTDTKIAFALVNIYGLAGRANDARRIFDALPETAKNSVEGRKLNASLNARCEDTPESRASLEKLLEREPRNASVLACLGLLYRVADPPRSLNYYEQAARLEPKNVGYAVGYGAALVQLKKFAEAATVLQRVTRAAPGNYAAHANFATALYELKLYKDAVVEYKWLAQARPDLAVVYYFIGSAHDLLGEYTDALAAYETFLARADARANQLEIDKVNLRLPSLRKQIKRGEGAKAQKKVER